jgi:hypothetical protein
MAVCRMGSQAKIAEFERLIKISILAGPHGAAGAEGEGQLRQFKGLTLKIVHCTSSGVNAPRRGPMVL